MKRSLLEAIDDHWFGEARWSQPTILRMTQRAHRQDVREERDATRHTPGQTHNAHRCTFDRYGSCTVVVDLPENHARPFLFAKAS